MMKYCQECGSEISETVTFCPYCGISQKPVQKIEEAAADEKTIAVNQWEWKDLVGKEPEMPQEEVSIKKPNIFPGEEKRETKTESEPPLLTAENWMPKTDSVDVPAQIVPDTDASLRIAPKTDDSLKFAPPEKETAGRVRESSFDSALEVFDEKAEIILKSQIELQRMIFVQNQRIIELLEQLLDKKP